MSHSQSSDDLYSVGIARRPITPGHSMYLSGYAARTHASEGVMHDLWVKAIGIQDGNGNRVLIVTADIIGLPRDICDEAAARIGQTHGLERKDILFNSSHTHSGPLVVDDSPVMFELDEEQSETTASYRSFLLETLVEAMDEALSSHSPAQLWYASGMVTFAVNRREPNGSKILNGYNPEGPSDHSVPVIEVTTPAGERLALIFAYACHPTTLGADSYLVSGDYAGFSQIFVESAFPGTTAFFIAGCGGDQNPLPRHSVELAKAYGQQLAAGVRRAIACKRQPLRGALEAKMVHVDLQLAPHSRPMFEARLDEAHELNPWRERHAQLMLQSYDENRAITKVLYPIQSIAFGESLTLLGLGGEVVVDYALRLKQEYRQLNLIVAGYCNDIMAYIPSRRVLLEGGYEGGDSMIFFGLPTPFTETIEETIMEGIRQVL